MTTHLQMVIARYQEDISWTARMPVEIECIVYNKFYRDEEKTLPNIGRESHTYLHHIVSNWYDLADLTAFVQGNPFEHTVHLMKKLSNIEPNIDFRILSDRILSERGRGGPHAPHIVFNKWYKLAFAASTGLDYYVFGAGAQFIVSRAAIYQRPRSFYAHLLAMISDPVLTEEFGHALERFWYYVFTLDHSAHPTRNHFL